MKSNSMQQVYLLVIYFDRTAKVPDLLQLQEREFPVDRRAEAEDFALAHCSAAIEMTRTVKKARAIRGLNELQSAQLADCINAGRTVQIKKPSRKGTPERTEAPLFGEGNPVQTNLF